MLTPLVGAGRSGDLDAAALVRSAGSVRDQLETPMDADLSIDTSWISMDDAVEQIPATLSVGDLIRLEDAEVRAWT